jgi:hypothetical protein
VRAKAAAPAAGDWGKAEPVVVVRPAEATEAAERAGARAPAAEKAEAVAAEEEAAAGGAAAGAAAVAAAAGAAAAGAARLPVRRPLSRVGPVRKGSGRAAVAASHQPSS